MVSQVAVLGATGQQGGAVAAALAKKGGPVAAITRNPDSDKAKALAVVKGTTVRKADLNDIDSIVAAFEGWDGAFIIANFWEGMDVDKEFKQYENVTTALKKVGGWKHIVFTTLEEPTLDTPDIIDDFKILHEHPSGPMKVPHFDGKARCEKLFDGLPTTSMVASCYFENFTSFFAGAITKQEDGTYTFTLPLCDKTVPWTILPDLGSLVAGAFGEENLVGKRIGQASCSVTGQELAAILSKATGKTIKYNEVSWESLRARVPSADELAQMFEFRLSIHDDFCKAHELAPQKEIMGCEFTDPVEYAKTLNLKWE